MTIISMRYIFYSVITFFLAISAGESYSAGVPVGDTTSSGHHFTIQNSAPFFFVDGKTYTGRLKYQFEVGGQIPGQTNYSVDYNGVAFEIGAGYYFKRLGILLSTGYGLLNYWSAEHRTIHFVELNNTVKPQSTTATTEHQFPDKFRFGNVGIEYQVPITGDVQIVPFITAQRWKYKDNRFFSNSAPDGPHYELVNNYALGAGVVYRAGFSDDSMIDLKIGLRKINFDPDGYFESLNAEDVQTSNTIIEFSIGYRFSFTNYQIGLLDYRINFIDGQ